MTRSEPSRALFTDLYELTMLDAYVEGGLMAEAVFDLFVRELPPQRNFLIVAGLADVVDHLAGLAFEPDDIAYLRSTGLFRPAFLDWLRDFRFTGDVHAMPEGTLAFAGEPLLEVVAPLPEAQLIETFLLNQVGTQTMLASKAARVLLAAEGRPVVDFGARRTHGIDAAMKAARASFLVGFRATSNVAAGQRYGIPVAGTMAHAFVQAHEDEFSAFRAFARRYPEGALLVDTYDTLTGVRRVVELSRELGDDFRTSAVRLDSGDLDGLARQTRAILDDAGLHDVQIFASGGLDEWAIQDLLARGAPVDAFGVGTQLGASADAPSLEVVYKLAAYGGRGRLKLSPGKATLPGRKQVWRHSSSGLPSEDVVALADEPAVGTPLLQQVMAGGAPIPDVDLTLDAARRRAAEALSTLPASLRSLDSAPPYVVTVSAALQAEAERVAARHA